MPDAPRNFTGHNYSARVIFSGSAASRTFTVECKRPGEIGWARICCTDDEDDAFAIRDALRRSLATKETP